MEEEQIYWDEIDWDNIFDSNAFDTDVDPSALPPIPSPVNGNLSNNPSPLSIVEQLLMKDDEDDTGLEIRDDFIENLLLDSPLEAERSCEVVDVSDGDNSVAEQQKKEAVADHKVDKDTSDDANDDPNDPIHKKRKRQLRNKDAALRSRERKKMYVRDLEMKSRYYEGECRRLGSILQCLMAENQALRFSLHSSKAFDASMTKQESAVLLLESLLLGSLLWFLGIMCQLILLSPLQQSLGAAQLEAVEEGKQQSPVLRKMGSKIFGRVLFLPILVGKRCKASRSRMKPSFHSLEALSKVLVVY